MSFLTFFFESRLPAAPLVCGYAAATRYSPRGGRSVRRSRDESWNDIYAQISTHVLLYDWNVGNDELAARHAG
jgi:hypothetical protein